MASMRARNPLPKQSTRKARATGLSIVQRELDSGLRVIVCPRPELSQVYCAAYFSIGSRHESAQENGITHILEHMLFRGTKHFPSATALNTAAEDIGGYLEGATYRDHLAIATSCHPAHTTKAIELIGEILTRPRYNDINIERSIIREELLETLDADGRMVELDNVAHKTIFGRHGLGQPIEGSLDFLEGVSVDALEAHRLRYCGGSNGTFSIAGPVDANRVLQATQRHFKTLHRGEPVREREPSVRQIKPICRFVRDSRSQVDLNLSFRAPAINDPSFPALFMLSRLLADGLASRMHAELVDRRGLAYALHAGIMSYSDCALFQFEAAVAPHRAAELLEALLHFVDSSRRFVFRQGERERVLRRYRYGMEFMNDSASELASWHGRNALFGETQLKAGLYRRLRKVDAAALARAAKNIFVSQGLVLTAVGELARGEWTRCRRLVHAF